MRTTSLSVHTVTTDEGLRALEPEWNALEDTSGTTLPFRTAAWTIAWWTHLRRQYPGVRDSLALRALRTRDGELVGVAPLMVTAYPGVGPFRARCLQFVGADPNLTELRGPLWAQGFEKAGVHALARDVARHASEWDWMAWNGIPANSSAAAILDRHVTWHTATPYYTLSLEGDWPGFKSRLGRNVKESLRKCYNSLKRDGLEHALSVVTQRADVETALHDFFRLHGERASANTTVRHPNYFQRPVNRAFLVDVCERLADRGQLRILRLHVGNRLVAVRIAFALRGSLYLYYSGYEAEYGKYSVMTTLVAETIQYAFAAGVTSVNLSVGNDVSKTRWSPREWVEYSAVTRSTRSRGRFAHAVYQLVDRALHAHEIRDYARALFSSAPSTAAA